MSVDYIDGCSECSRARIFRGKLQDNQPYGHFLRDGRDLKRGDYEWFAGIPEGSKIMLIVIVEEYPKD